jgi:multimeric flavodoxin WrbA
MGAFLFAMKMLIVNGSPRAQGTDAAIIGMVSDTAKKNGYDPEVIDICGLNIHGCRACMACKKTGKCAQKDDMTPLYEKIKTADMIVIASPIYFGAESGQMKCFIDRFYAMLGIKDGKFIPDMGQVKKASIVLVCGAPDGNMSYGGVLARMINVFKSLGIIDASGAIIPGVSPENVKKSDYVRDYIGALEFQVAQ